MYNTLLLLLTVAAVVWALATTIALVSARRERRAAGEAAREAQREALQQREERSRTESELAAARAAAAAEIAALKEQRDAERAAEREQREAQQEQLKAQFRNLATEIFGEQSKQFRETNRESLDVLLKPFRDNITEFRERVERIYSDENRQRGALQQELKSLMELNHRITTETTNLTNALRGNSKVQGDWGETMLETILESSSLVKGLHYETQHNLKDSEGRNLRPDVILKLPGAKRIVIDSKVSLTAYVAYTAATEEAERRRQLEAHLVSVRKHVQELGNKAYQQLLHSPDFVILFVANEPAYLEALKADPTIWNDAYDRKVLLSSPTNLFAVLKLVADLWKYDAQDKNTKRIAECGLKLYEQAVAFSSSLEAVGTALGRAQEAYEDARKRLATGNNNIVRVGLQLKETARLQSKKSFSPALQELSEADDAAADPTVRIGETPLPEPADHLE